MINESNIPRFKQRLEIRYDNRPALRDGSDELGVRPFNRMGECELHGRPPWANYLRRIGVKTSRKECFHAFSPFFSDRLTVLTPALRVRKKATDDGLLNLIWDSDLERR